MQVKVNGFVRVPGGSNTDNRIAGITTAADTIKLFTPYGAITLQGAELSFDSSVPDVFLMAGFTATPQKRRLLGIAELVGFFNQLAAWKANNPNTTMQVPALAKRSKSTTRTYVTCGEGCNDMSKSGTFAEKADTEGAKSDAFVKDLVKPVGVAIRNGGRYTYHDEVGLSFTDDNDVTIYKSNKTYPHWPFINSVKIDNGTHVFKYQEFNGTKYHCSIKAKSNRTKGAPEKGDDDVDPNRFTFNGTRQYHIYGRDNNQQGTADDEAEEADDAERRTTSDGVFASTKLYALTLPK
jgi:hypothetical protein